LILQISLYPSSCTFKRLNGRGGLAMKKCQILIIISLSLLNTFFFPTIVPAQVFDFQWGSAGTSQGQFNLPIGVAIDSTGNVFVLDSNRVQKFDSNGAYLTFWSSPNPKGIAIDSTDNIYVTNYNNSAVSKYSNGGIFISLFGSGQLFLPTGIAIDSSNNVYVLDYSSSKVNKFASNENFLLSWGGPGTANGQFANPQAIGIDGSGRIYVCDGVNRIQIFDSNGTYLGTWGVSGTGDGQLYQPMGICFDTAGNLYVTEFGNSRIQKWNGSGGYLTKWGIFGKSEGRFDWPYGVAVNDVGDIYVVDSRNNRIQVFTQPLPVTFDASGTWNSSWTNKRTTDQNGFICTPEANSTGGATVTQNGQYVTAIIEGTEYSGFVSGTTYNVSVADTIDTDTIITEEFILTLTSATAGSGNSYSSVTDNAGAYCLGEGDISLNKASSVISPPVNPSGGDGGGGGGGCFISTLLN
jgi:sugar lactone lactonase YvrE